MLTTAEAFPMIQERFTGKHIELGFSENLVLKPKFELQDAHFCDKQYSLYCSIVEPVENENVHHLCDYTNNDPIL